MVGTLVDERADTKDVIATLVDLARRGVLAIQEESKPGLFGIGKSQEFTYHLENAALPMRPYEKLPGRQAVRRRDRARSSPTCATKFYVTMGQVQERAVSGAGGRGLLPRPARSGRAPRTPCWAWPRWSLAFCAGLFRHRSSWCSGAAWRSACPSALAIPAIGLIVLARYMPRKTANGAEEAAKWLAFKRYMENIEQYTKVEEVAGDLRPLPALRHRLRAGKELDRQVRPGRYAAAALVSTPGPYMGPRPRRLGLVAALGR